MVKKWHSLLFLCVIILAIFLRFGGIYPSFPPYHSDEGMSYAQGIAIIKENTLDADGYSLSLGYPYLIPYINALVFRLFFIPLSWSKFYITNIDKIVDGVIHLPLSSDEYSRFFQLNILGAREIYVLSWGRTISASFGVGIVIILYFLVRQILNKNIALITSFLASINYRQVLNSHINLPDIYNAFFLTLSMFFSYRITKHRRPIDFLLAGIFVGLSISTKFHTYAVFGFLAAYLIYLTQDKNKFITKILSCKIIIAGIAGLIIFLIINPYHFIHLEKALDTIRYVALKYGVGRYKIIPFPFWYLFNFGIGKLTSIVIVIGLVLMLIKKNKNILFHIISCSYFLLCYYIRNKWRILYQKLCNNNSNIINICRVSFEFYFEYKK